MAQLVYSRQPRFRRLCLHKCILYMSLVSPSLLKCTLKSTINYNFWSTGTFIVTFPFSLDERNPSFLYLPLSFQYLSRRPVHKMSHFVFRVAAAKHKETSSVFSSSLALQALDCPRAPLKMTFNESNKIWRKKIKLSLFS